MIGVKVSKRVASLGKAYKQVCNGYLRLDREFNKVCVEASKLREVNKKLRNKIKELRK